MIAETSTNAYRVAKARGLVKSQAEHIYDIIEHSTGDLSNDDIVSLTGIKESSVTARVNKLVEDGRVRKSGYKIGRFGVHVKTWEINSQPEQVALFNMGGA